MLCNLKQLLGHSALLGPKCERPAVSEVVIVIRGEMRGMPQILAEPISYLDFHASVENEIHR